MKEKDREGEGDVYLSIYLLAKKQGFQRFM